MKYRLIILTLNLLTGVSCNDKDKTNHPRYQKINNPSVLKFQILKTDTKEPLGNGKAHFVSYIPCLHCPNVTLRADSTEIDNKGLFEFSEKIFEYEWGSSFSIKDENRRYPEKMNLSKLKYDRQNRKLHVQNYTEFFNFLYKQDIYDLKSNKVTQINGRDTIQSTYKRIKIYANQKEAPTESLDFIKILKEEQDHIVLLEKTWKLTKKIVPESYNKHLETEFWKTWDYFITKIRFNYFYSRKNDGSSIKNADKKNRLRPETFLEIAQKTDDLNKKYYFIVGAGIIFNSDLQETVISDAYDAYNQGDLEVNDNIPLTDSTIKMGDKILSEMNLFLDKNEIFVDNKLEELRSSGFDYDHNIFPDCHPMQKIKGKIITSLEVIKFGLGKSSSLESECELGK